MAFLAMAGGAAGGLKLREARLAHQVSTADRAVSELLQRDSYIGHRKARDWIARIEKVRSTDESLARLAVAEARLAGEFGDDTARAEAIMGKLASLESVQALEASAYLALADGDERQALEMSKLLSTAAPEAWSSHYLEARALILAGDGEGAKIAIARAIKVAPTLLSYVALARAEALLSRFPEALAAMGRALSIADEHPSAVIWQARILVAAGELPKNASDPDDTLSGLVQRSRTGGEVSASQGAWAGLVLAEIKVQRGDVAAAKTALAEAKIGRPSGWMFSEMLTDLLIRLGNLDQALVEAEMASETWPTRSKPRISRARIRLSKGDPNSALEVLEEVQNIENLPEALAARGQAQLRLGKLGKATTDLERALTLSPRLADAVIARAKVDILRGQPKAAIGRLEPMYDRTASSELAIVYAAALRTNGKAKAARDVLAPISGTDGTLGAVIELARLERSEGRFEEARKVFARAIDMVPQSLEALLGAAELDIDDGRVQEGRKALDALVAKGARNGRALLACARARSLTGDTQGASDLLDQVDAAWLGWKIARERGRILLHRLAPIEAISELHRAQSLRSGDMETRYLLMEAHFEANSVRGSARSLEEIAKSFRNDPVRAFASGTHALLTNRGPDAVASFTEARSMLIESKGSRLELAKVAYWLGRSFEVSGDLRKAAQWLQKATTLNASHALAHFWAGQIHHQEQDLEKMVASYETVVALDPGAAPMAWFFLGSHYGEAGRKDDAVRALEMFLQHYPENSGDMVVEAKVLIGKMR
ncbi:MAG: tetratricopeptide repeat protein [Myxococcales bacterium]|nr:tetratricopeptide repeat protein [Myxococcales bacterium]